MTRLRLLCGVLLLLLLTACGQEPAPTVTPVPTEPPTVARALPTDTTAPAATMAQVLPTATALPPAVPATPTPAPAPTTPLPIPPATVAADLTNVSHGLASIFIVPSAVPSPTSHPVVLDVRTAVGGGPDIAQELDAYFKAFYAARTLQRDNAGNITTYLDLDQIRNLTDEPYRDYTLALLQKDSDEADAGRLLSVAYTDLSVKVGDWQPGADGSGTALVTVHRTRHDTRKGIAPTAASADLQFRLRRSVVPDPTTNLPGPSWVAYDYFNAGTNQWVSETVPPPTADINKEIAAFFQAFYAARTLPPGGKFDIAKTQELTAGAYQDYTLPLLQGQQAEADAGKLTSVSYSDIQVVVDSWFPQATSHGGVAEVHVTRTSHVVRPAGAEPPTTATYAFRVHRHWDEQGNGLWLAVDFFSPITNQWVSGSAGLSGAVPAAGHG